MLLIWFYPTECLQWKPRESLLCVRNKFILVTSDGSFNKSKSSYGVLVKAGVIYTVVQIVHCTILGFTVHSQALLEWNDFPADGNKLAWEEEWPFLIYTKVPFGLKGKVAPTQAVYCQLWDRFVICLPSQNSCLDP